MTVERRFSIFDLNKVLFDRVITSEHVRDAFAAVGYLYEALGNEAPPYNGAQVYAGHDHAEQGGAPITRGCVGSQFGGRTPIFEAIPTSNIAEIDATDAPYRGVYKPTLGVNKMGCHVLKLASPGIDTIANNVYWEMRLRVHWPKDAGYNCKLRIENMDFEYPSLALRRESKVQARVDLEIEPLDEMQELVALVPVKGDWWNRLNFRVEALGGSAPYIVNFAIYDYQIHETQQYSQPRSRGQSRYR